MSFSLIPTSFSIYMTKHTKIGIIFAVCLFFATICITLCGAFEHITTTAFIITAVIVLTAICLRPCIANNKLIYSQVEFSLEGIEVRDKKGFCWRVIPYETITNVQVEEVFGFFFGTNRERIVAKYICFYLNGEKTRPDVPYSKMFIAPDFFLMGYQADALALFQKMHELYNIDHENDRSHQIE